MSSVLGSDCKEAEFVKCKGILLQSNQCNASKILPITVFLFFENDWCVFPFFAFMCVCVSMPLCLHEV